MQGTMYTLGTQPQDKVGVWQKQGAVFLFWNKKYIALIKHSRMQISIKYHNNNS